MQVKVDGKRNITLDFEAPKKFKLLQDGKEIPYLRTGKNSFRLSRNIDGVLDLEEIKEKPAGIVKSLKIQPTQISFINPNDVLMINQAAQQLEVEQNILGETQKRVEQTQAYLDIQQQRINETVLSVQGLETDNVERITATENGLFNLAGNLATTEQNLIDGIEIINNGLQEHKSAENPHGITKKTIGLDKVDNTSDLDKPISKAVQNALDEKADKDEIQAIRDELGEYQEKNDRFTNALSNYTGGLAGNQLPDGGSTGQILAKRTDISGDVEWINSSASITIDDELSLTSKNPVQNKVITNKINSEVANLTTRVGNLETGKQDKLTQVQLDAINSGANTTNIGQIATNTSDIADINALIPNQATTSNQLADQGFVNSSIATNTAYFIGTFNSVAELEAYSGTLTNNDYAFVSTTDTAGNTLYDRYKWNGSQWLFEYELNNSSFTASQWASINSGATAEKIAKISTNETTINNHIANTSNPHEVTKTQVGLGDVDNTSDLDKPISTATQTALNSKQDILTAGTNIIIDSNNVISSTAQESFFRGRWATWTTVPTDTSLYPEDYHGNRVPNNNDYMVIEDASDYVSEPSPAVRVETKSTWGGGAIITVTNIVNGQTVDIVHTSASGEIQLFDNDVYVTYSSPLWYIYSKNAPIVINDVIYPVGTKYHWSYGSVVDFVVNTSITNISGAWRFAYHGEWSTDGKNGWLPEYQLENVLPIASDTVAGITKIYSTTGQNTDGTMTQKSITDSLATKQDVISDLATIRSGAALGATAVQPSDLATVATSGSYNDLSNKPTIPTVNNATLTIQKNGTNVATFTANASSNVTANIGVPNTVSSVSSSSTNADAVGAKLFYDTCGDIEALINAL